MNCTSRLPYVGTPTGIQDYLCQLDARATEDYAEEPDPPASLEFLQVA